MQLNDITLKDKELFESGMFNNKVYALPYIVSGYAEIKHSELSSTFLCGNSEYVNGVFKF